jgi:hypothetical protein
MIRDKYTTIGNYTVVGIREDESRKLKHFIVCDRNGEKVTDKEFDPPREAIMYINTQLKENGICDD